jgi:hypothetical protein
MLNLDVAAKVNFGDAAAVARKAKSLASLTDATVNTMLASLFFAVGDADKTAKANELRDTRGAFNAFSAEHHSEAAGRKPLSAKSADAYASTFRAFAEAGFHPGYDAAPVANFVLDTIKGAFTSRGATLRAILKAHPTTCPTADELAAFVKAKAAETPRGVAEKARKLLDDAFGSEGDHVSALVNPSIKLAYLDAMAALSTLVDALPSANGAVSNFAVEAAKLRESLKK